MEPTTARCALHLDALATVTCARCGRYCCERCVEVAEPPWCQACAEGRVDPWQLRRPFGVGHAVSVAVRACLAEARGILVVVLVVSLLALVFEVAILEPFGGTRLRLKLLSALFELVFQTTARLIVLALLIARVEGRALGLRGALRETKLVWFRAIGASVRSSLWTLAALLLFLVPGVVKAVELMFVPIVVMRVKHHEPLRYSEELVRGRFWRALALGLLVVALMIAASSFPVLLTRLFAPLPLVPGLVSALVSTAAANLVLVALIPALLLTTFQMLHHQAGLRLPEMRWAEAPPLRAEP
ncbi:MAG: hypothetical protein ACOZQL_22570 [Myxococcota bacterium]